MSGVCDERGERDSGLQGSDRRERAGTATDWTHVGGLGAGLLQLSLELLQSLGIDFDDVLHRVEAYDGWLVTMVGHKAWILYGLIEQLQGLVGLEFG